MERDVVTALVLSILFWKDSTPETSFPSILELVKIELGRVLSHRNLFRDFPWLRSALGNRLVDELAAEPWDVNPEALMRRYTAAIPEDRRAELGQAIREATLFDDPAFVMLVRRRNLPSATADSILSTSAQVAEVLGVDGSDPFIADTVREMYHQVFRQLVKTRG